MRGAPSSVTMWICPSGEHVYKDQKSVLDVSGTASRGDGGRWVPLCQGLHDPECGDRKCHQVFYLRAGIQA